MKIKLATINLEVADPQASKRFYIDVLGMTENAHRSHEPSFVYLDSEGCDLTLALPPAGGGAEPSRTMEVGFEVDDMAALKARLEERGVTGFKPQSMGWGDVLEGHDPDGHRVILYCFNRD